MLLFQSNLEKYVQVKNITDGDHGSENENDWRNVLWQEFSQIVDGIRDPLEQENNESDL